MKNFLISAFGSIDRNDIMKALEITWKGLVAIIIVIAIIIAATVIMNLIVRKAADTRAKKAAAKQNSADTENHDGDGEKN